MAGFFKEFCGGWTPWWLHCSEPGDVQYHEGLHLGYRNGELEPAFFLRTWAAWLMSVWDFGGWLVGEHRLQKSENSNANHANHLLYETEAFVRLSTNLS